MPRNCYRLYLTGGIGVFSTAACRENRAPNPADILQLAEMMLSAYIGTIDYDGETLEDALREVGDFFAGGSGQPLLEASRVAVDGGRLVSAVLVSLWEGHPLIAYIMTHSAYKRNGCAARLLSCGLHGLKQQGYSAVRAFITEGNFASEGLFENSGFVRVSGVGADV